MRIFAKKDTKHKVMFCAIVIHTKQSCHFSFIVNININLIIPSHNKSILFCSMQHEATSSRFLFEIQKKASVP